MSKTVLMEELTPEQLAERRDKILVNGVTPGTDRIGRILQQIEMTGAFEHLLAEKMNLDYGSLNKDIALYRALTDTYRQTLIEIFSPKDDTERGYIKAREYAELKAIKTEARMYYNLINYINNGVSTRSANKLAEEKVDTGTKSLQEIKLDKWTVVFNTSSVKCRNDKQDHTHVFALHEILGNLITVPSQELKFCFDCYEEEIRDRSKTYVDSENAEKEVKGDN